MEEIMNIIFQYAPMNGSANKVIKNFIIEFESFKSHFIIEYFQGYLEKDEIERILNKSFIEFWIDSR